MKRINIIVLIIITLGVVPFSCVTDLEEELKGSLSESTLTSEKDAFTLIDGCYHTLLEDGWSYHAYKHIWLNDGITDVMVGGKGKPLDELKWDEDIALDTWTNAFKLVSRTNTAIDLINKMDDTEFDDPAIKDRLIGEALFLRCLAYSDLTSMFGDVPLIVTPITDGSALPARDPVSKVYEQIEKDLLTAIDYLPVSYDKEIGRATKGAAFTMLAKIYIRQKKFPEAKNALDSVISLHVYDLFTEGSYRDLWLESHVKDNEFIFVVMSHGVDYNVATNHHIKWFSPWGFDLGWAKVGVPKEIFYAMRSDDARTEVIHDDLSDAYYSGVRKDSSAIKHFGYVILGKYSGYNRDVTAPNNIWGNYACSKLNVPIYRYADVLLLKADVENELNNGPNDAAYEAINEVRQRAKIPDLTPGLSYDQFKDSVLLERGIELVGEGCRRDDLINHDVFEEKINAYLLSMGYNNPTHVTKEYRLFPIPRRELDLNPNMKPNPINSLVSH